MGLIDQPGIRTVGDLQFLQSFADDVDFGNDLLGLPDPPFDHPQFRRTVLDLALRPADLRLDLADGFLGETVDQRELEARRGRDLLDFVLAVDVGLEHKIPVERHRHRLAIVIEDLHVVTPRPLRPIARAVLGLDLEIDRAAAEIAPAHDLRWPWRAAGCRQRPASCRGCSG